MWIAVVLKVAEQKGVDEDPLHERGIWTPFVSNHKNKDSLISFSFIQKYQGYIDLFLSLLSRILLTI